ncbi:hypothetical protein BV25DRAFT_974195 [Artomyces pyxidatus]|uniref:Uncharacterized protein n=1 Tax=Artomyces pyxidatus TaxID=48021 RepID=A0ACB8SWM3_9AGAM|nr:hypothetical protein BV25DRAFT_974195 [Artomyces pyxidatus]
MHQTAWTRNSALTSDRLRPTSPAAPSKAKQRQPDPPKSAEARRLEALLRSLAAPPPAQKPLSSDACFCQARLHALSPYTPLCTHCGLVLCTLTNRSFMTD